MAYPDHLSGYYPGEAVQAMELAHADNRDFAVGLHLSRAIGALRELINRGSAPHEGYGGAVSDPYEINESNSAV